MTLDFHTMFYSNLGRPDWCILVYIINRDCVLVYCMSQYIRYPTLSKRTIRKFISPENQNWIKRWVHVQLLLPWENVYRYYKILYFLPMMRRSWRNFRNVSSTDGLTFFRSKHIWNFIWWDRFKDIMENMMLWRHFSMAAFVYRDSFKTV